MKKPAPKQTSLTGARENGETNATRQKLCFAFDGPLSRHVLESYLARCINMTGMTDSPHLDDDLRMLENIGAKFIGRAALIWWGDRTRVDFEQHFAKARALAARVFRQDPDCILEAGVMETVGPGIDTIPIPPWVFEAFELPPEERAFDHSRMRYDDGYAGHGHGTLPPDISKLETRLWFYYCCRRYIDCGYEAIHLGMIGLMDRQDPGHRHWFNLLERLRHYAQEHARRHWVLFNSQVPYGIVEDGRLLLDHHQMQLRPVEVVRHPEQCILEAGYGDTLYGRSLGGVTPSGWACDHLPYYIQFDNGYPTGKTGQPIGFPYAWGSCEIDWYARQSETYRNEWLLYADDWLRRNDPAGFLQAPGRVPLGEPLERTSGPRRLYVINTPSEACPDGFNQEKTVKAMWNEPQPLQQPIFISGRDGYHTYRIPALCVTKSGVVLAFCEGRRDSPDDTGQIDLLLRRSLDGGRTFLPTQVVVSEPAMTCGNPAPVVDADTGRIYLATTRNHADGPEHLIIAGKAPPRTVRMTHSDDDGATWAPSVEITAAVAPAGWTWYATGPCHGIQLQHGARRGRLVIPCDFVLGKSFTYEDPFYACVIYSDDHGATWQAGGAVAPDVNECVALETGDGRLYLNCRNWRRPAGHPRACAWSDDGGESFGPVEFAPELPEPGCQASAVALPASPGRPRGALFAGPCGASRRRMTVHLSTDDCRTWQPARCLHEGPAAYSDLAVLTSGDVLCLYECGGGVEWPYETITLARFGLSWLTAL